MRKTVATTRRALDRHLSKTGRITRVTFLWKGFVYRVKLDPPLPIKARDRLSFSPLLGLVLVNEKTVTRTFKGKKLTVEMEVD